MSAIKLHVFVEEINCTAELKVSQGEQDPDFWEQFDTRGEAIEALVTQMAEKVAEELRQAYDLRDTINSRIEELGK